MVVVVVVEEDCVAVFSSISHLTAGLASGNRKYDITALTFRNVGMSGQSHTCNWYYTVL